MDLDSSAFYPPGAFDDDGEPLQSLDWAGLVAKLGAERDLRRELSSRIGAAASFAGGAAWALDGRSQGELPVNPDALTDLKPTGGITPATEAETPAAGIDARGQK